MIRLVEARYGRDALDRLVDVVAAHKGGDPMRAVTVLAPNNIAGIVARRRLAAGGAGTIGIAGLEVTTVPRLAERIAANSLAPRRPATRAVVTAAWRRQLQTDPGIFADVAEHPATISALARAHTELREVSADGRRRLSDEATLIADVIRLQGSVASELAPHWYDARDLLVTAAAQVGSDGFPDPVVVYLPQLLTPGELLLLRSLAQVTDVTVLAGRTGAERADRVVLEGLAALGLSPEFRPKVTTAHEVLNASDSDDEVRCVVRRVVAELATTPASRVGILYASSAPYARLLHEHLEAAGIATNGPGIRAVNERAVARTLLEVLRLPDHDFARPDLFRAISHGPTLDFHGRRIPVSRWERTSRSARVIRGTDWTNRLTRCAAEERAGGVAALAADPTRTWLAERHETKATNADELRDFATRLQAELQQAADLRTWAALADWCSRLFETLVGTSGGLLRLPPEEQHAAATVVSTLRSLGVLGDVAGTDPLKTLADVLDVEFSASSPRVGRFGEGVLVAPLSTAVGLDLDVVHVVGLSEDQYPGSQREDALLPSRVRALAPGELVDAREQLHQKYRHLLIAFTSASRVVVSFPRGDLRRSTTRLPSRWLLPTLRELSGDRTLSATTWEDATYPATFVTSGSFAGELLSTGVLAQEQEWRVRAAMTGALVDSDVTAARALLDARASDRFTRFDGNLAGVAGLPDYANEDRSVSPTMLEGYAQCPHAFFVDRLLGVKPIEQPEDLITISPADVGTFIHDCMDRLVIDFTEGLPGHGDPWTAEQRARLAAIADEVAAEFEERGLTGHHRLWSPERLRILTTLVAMLDEDDDWRAGHGSRVVASELTFGMRGEPPIEVVIPSGRILMKGSADKVDSADGRLFVTDIKTGSKRTFKDISQEEPLHGGTKLQLPIYAYAARERHGDRATPVSAGYWFVHRDPGRVTIELTPDVEARFAETLDVLVNGIVQGLFPPKAPETADFSWVQCNYCNPDGIGHADVRDRWDRKRHDPALDRLLRLIEPNAVQEDPA
ncbi:MAG: PD-(D/E)XK nuclease family protein [Nocardioides sp.]